MLKSGANVLLLDEPTNDLDVDTLRALEDALLEFAGCVVVITHDRWFLDRIATHMLAFEGDIQVTWFEGNYQDYEANRQDAPRRRSRPAAPHQVQAAGAGLATGRTTQLVGDGGPRRTITTAPRSSTTIQARVGSRNMTIPGPGPLASSAIAWITATAVVAPNNAGSHGGTLRDPGRVIHAKPSRLIANVTRVSR